MAQAPDIRVRLTPEGVNDVLAAFKRIENDSTRVGRATAGAFSGVQGVAKNLAGLLPAISFAAVTAGLVSLTRSAVNNADEMGKMAQRVGSTAETLSVLSLAATTADVSQEQLQKGLVKLARTLDDAKRGNADAIDSFGRIGITPEQIKSFDDTGLAFVKLSEKMAATRDEGAKTALSTRLLGKGAAEQIPLLNSLAEEGFENVTKRAKEMGLFISTDMAKAAERANDAFTTIKNQARGLATAFASGFAPAIANAMESFTKSTQGDGVKAMEEFGKSVGENITSSIRFFLALTKTVGATIAVMEDGFSTLNELRRQGLKDVSFFDIISSPLRSAGKIAGNVFGGDFEAIRDRARARQSAIIDNLSEDFERIFTQGAAATPGPRKPPGSGVGLGTSKEMLDAARARLAFLKAQLDAELALFQAQNRLQEQRNQQAFDEELISLQAYWDKRLQLSTRAIDEEIRVLEEKRKLAAQAPTQTAADVEKRNTEVANIDNQLRIKQIERIRTEENLLFQQREAQKRLAEERLQLDQRILESQGRVSEAALKALDEEIRKTDEFLRKQGEADANRLRILSGIRERGTRDIAAREVRSEGDLELRDLQIQREAILRQVQTGQIMQFEGEARIIELEKSRLPVLRDIAAEMLRLAQAAFDADQNTTNAFKVKEAEEFAAAIEQIAVNVNKAGRELAEMKQRSFEALSGELSNFLTKGLQDAKNFGEAIKTLGFNLSQAFQKISADRLANMASEKIFSLLGLAGDGPDKVAVAGAAGAAQAAPLTAASAALSAAGTMVTTGAAAISAAAAQLMAAATMLTTAQVTSTASSAASALGQAGLMGSFFGAAEGGQVRGPGTGTSDSVGPVMLSNEEFVTRSKVVRQPGALAFLDAFNRHGMALLRPLRQPAAPKFMADGGLVGGGGRLMDGTLTVRATPGTEVVGYTSPEGQRSLIKVITANKHSIRTALGI